MPLFNRFPYTNFHELNLDWILEQIPILKKYRDETEELHDDTKVLHDDTKVLHDDTKVLHDNVVEQHKEITAEITQGKKDISDLTNTGKAEITELTNTSKHEISDLTDESKHAITDLTNSGKSELNTIITNGTNQLDTLIDTGKQDIKTLTDSGKSAIDTATTTGKAEITNTVTDGKAQIATAKDGALEAIGTAKDSATTTIKNLESSATNAITAKGDLYLHKIEDEGTKQTQAVTDAGTTQVTNITQLGETYKTEMTTLKNEAQTSADNAKASETKAQEYAETAKTLKPMFWGGDSDNLHSTLNVKQDCINFLNSDSAERYSNIRILKDQSIHKVTVGSPNGGKEWQCKISYATSDTLDLLAWSSDSDMYIGTFTATDEDITWRRTPYIEDLYKMWGSYSINITTWDEDMLKEYNNFTIPVGFDQSPDSTKKFYAKTYTQEQGTYGMLAWSKDGDMYVGNAQFRNGVASVIWNKTVNLDEIHAEISADIAELTKKSWTSHASSTALPLVDDTNLTIQDIITQGITNFEISSSSKYHYEEKAKFNMDTLIPQSVEVKVLDFGTNTITLFAPIANAYTTIVTSENSCTWIYARSLTIADYSKKFKKPTLQYHDTNVSTTFGNYFNPLSNEYHINMSFIGENIGEYTYKLTTDTIPYAYPTQQVTMMVVYDTNTQERTSIPVIITHNTGSTFFLTISESDKTKIVNKQCFMTFTIYSASKQ